MEMTGLYGFVLGLVMVGVLIGAGLVVLTNFQASSGIAGTIAATAIGNTSSAIASIATTWLGIIVIIAIMGLVIGYILRSFTGTTEAR